MIKVLLAVLLFTSYANAYRIKYDSKEEEAYYTENKKSFPVLLKASDLENVFSDSVELRYSKKEIERLKLENEQLRKSIDGWVDGYLAEEKNKK